MKLSGFDFYVTNLFKKFFKKLNDTYPEHTFEVQIDSDYEKFGQGGIFSCMSFSIINPETQNYILISLFDNWKYHFMKHMGWNPKKMKKFFYAGGFNYLDYYNFKSKNKFNSDIEFPDNITNVYESFFYNPYFDCCYDFMEEIYKNRKPKHRKLIFRGWMWESRIKMTDGINRNDIIIIDKNKNNSNLNYSNYLKELSDYVSILSLPGGTEICNRDIESFGIGSPVIRPQLSVNYPDPLIPNYHYISFYNYCDYTENGNPKYIDYDSFKKNLEYTWDLVKNNDEYLNFISQNARNWFVKNCSIENNINYFINKIDLKNLN
jgi:hypothetical protein